MVNLVLLGLGAGNPMHRTIVTRIKIFMILNLKTELF